MLDLCSRRAVAALALGMSLCGAGRAQTVFVEDFQSWFNPTTHLSELRCGGPGGAGTYPFPETWLLRNVDGRTPDAQVSYVNDAWSVRDDFSLGDATKCAAFSTSFYAPAAQADDWAWTRPIALPAAGASLSWRAVAYDPAYRDGYEVRAMPAPATPTGGTGVLGNQESASVLVFSTAGEATSWTAHTVDLSAYAGQTVSIGFRNHSVDKFILLIDDVSLQQSGPDLAAVAGVLQIGDYAFWPDGAQVDVDLAVTASNRGSVGLSHVAGQATLLRDGVPAGPPLLSATLTSLPVGLEELLNFGSSPLQGNGAWEVRFDLSADQSAAEVNVANNTTTLPITRIGGLQWTRFDGAGTSVIGIGAGNGGEIGVLFTLNRPQSFAGVRFGMSPITQPAPPDPPVDWAGRDIVAQVRALDPDTGKPGAILATTVAVVSSDAGGVYDTAFVGGVRSLPSGSYVVTVAEPVGGAQMPLITSLGRFQPDTVWANWPTSPSGWTTIETFGTPFQRTPQIALLIEQSLFKDSFEALPTVARGVQVAAPRLAEPARPLRAPRVLRLAPPR